MRKINVGDTMYLMDTEYEIKKNNLSKEDWEGEDDGFNDILLGWGCVLSNENGDLWIPYAVKSLLSYTPYTISKDGKLEGFTYEKPWMPKQNEVVWVRNSPFEDWKLKVFIRISKNNKYPYVASSTLLDGGDELLNCELFNQCKPFDANELRCYENSKVPTPQEGDLVIVWDNDMTLKDRTIRIFEKASISGFYVCKNANKSKIIRNTATLWDNCIPYDITQEGVTPVMVQYEPGGGYIIGLLVETKEDVKKFAKLQGIDEENYIYDKGNYHSYLPYDKNNLKFDLTD